MNVKNNQMKLQSLIEQRISRRSAMISMAATTTAVVAGGQLGMANAVGNPNSESIENLTTLEFREVPHGIDQGIHVAPEHVADPFIRWGDPLFVDSPTIDFDNLSASDQLKQFGYNNDFVTYLPLPYGSDASDHGLLCVNHEYTNAELLFDDLDYRKKAETMDKQQSMFEMAAHGHSVVEIKRENGKWKVVMGEMNRRISTLETRCKISGPAAGNDRLKTSDSPDGTTCTGTINNCAGGVTPWGTVLVAEENFQTYFGGQLVDGPELENHKRYGLGDCKYAWYRFFRRFDVEKEPRGPNLFGWIIEYDPYDPKSVPVKRTQLGRMRHEGATTALTADGRIAVYSGDDQENQFFYRFVSRDKCNPKDRLANKDLLDDGVLSVARFDEDGTVKWLPLVFGKGKLTKASGFNSQADVLIDTRKAAQLLGATPMDRPEDAETNPSTGRVYLMLTNSASRSEETCDAANPRPNNIHGHIIELMPPGSENRLDASAKLGNDRGVDHGADEYRWEVFLKGGNPAEEDVGAKYHAQVTDQGWLSCPDNCTFDNRGRMWIATDGAPKSAEVGDAIYACDTYGSGRALTKQFFRGPIGAEICGPCFTPDSTTLFVAVQHPGENSPKKSPTTRWPDFDEAIPPRPSVVAITRPDGKPIG